MKGGRGTTWLREPPESSNQLAIPEQRPVEEARPRRIQREAFFAACQPPHGIPAASNSPPGLRVQWGKFKAAVYLVTQRSVEMVYTHYLYIRGAARLVSLGPASWVGHCGSDIANSHCAMK